MDLREHFKDGYILVVEDMTSMRRTIRSMLKQVGLVNVVDADDGDTALHILDTQDNCHFILLDWNMPRMSGIDVVREIRSKAANQDIPILMVTCEMGSAEVMQAGEAGVNGYIVKPFVAKTLEEKIQAVLATRAAPPEHVRLLKAGEELALRGEYEEALAIFERAKILRESARIHVSIGETRELTGEDAKAHESYNAAIALNPLFLKAHLRSAALYEKQGNLDAALAAFKKVVEISPNNPRRHFSIGNIHLKKGDIVKAKEAYTLAVRQEAAMASEIAEELLKHGKDDMAEHFFRTSLQKQANNVHVYNRLGISLRRQGKWKEAILEYETAIKIDPKDAGIHFNIGKACVEGGQRERAYQAFRKALDLDPTLTEAKTEMDALNKRDLWD
ncbi:MAG: tetratricopeptide repeat protein [Nitrospinae bacterium]|nr:tetratricopeptide repeat protein [Nitrospinota bacterium]